MLRRVMAFGVVMAFVVLLSGCALQPVLDKVGDRGNGPEVLQVQAAGQGKSSLDELFAEVASRVPAFGGMFIEGDILFVYLLNPGQKVAAERAIVAVFGRERIPAGGIQVLQGQYGFAQLKNWHDRLISLLDLEGVLLTDIDEGQNRLKVGVEQLALASAVEQQLASLGIPKEAVLIVEAEPIVPMLTLRDKVRPLVGGLQINFPGFLCTLGFNAIRSSISGFVINSHCTETQGGVENTPYWQPLEAADTFIGTEIADPLYTKDKCPRSLRGKLCRYSDSAFAQHDPAVITDPGLLARTDGANTGSLTIAGSFRIVGESAALKGETVNKVGRTTGWTQGQVTDTCVNTGVLGSRIVQLCQDFVSAGVGAGDSGSPVFRITNSSQTNDVLLYGILWGGNQAGTSFVYSPIANVQRTDELGPLTNCAVGFSC